MSVSLSAYKVRTAHSGTARKSCRVNFPLACDGHRLKAPRAGLAKLFISLRFKLSKATSS